MFVNVTTETVIRVNNHGLTFCSNNTPVIEYANGLSTGGTRGEKNNTSDSITNCNIIYLCAEKTKWLTYFFRR